MLGAECALAYLLGVEYSLAYMLRVEYAIAYMLGVECILLLTCYEFPRYCNSVFIMHLSLFIMYLFLFIMYLFLSVYNVLVSVYNVLVTINKVPVSVYDMQVSVYSVPVMFKPCLFSHFRRTSTLWTTRLYSNSSCPQKTKGKNIQNLLNPDNINWNTSLDGQIRGFNQSRFKNKVKRPIGLTQTISWRLRDLIAKT